MDLASVIIPTYNRSGILKKSIDSVLNQTYPNIEIIVVDDCSNDDTYDVIASLKNPKIKYFRLEKNSGACAARNEGIRQSNGKYIAFQDSDDEWHSDKLLTQIEIMKANKAQISFCNFIRYEENASQSSVFQPNLEEGFVDYLTLLKKSIASTQCIVGESECFNAIQFDETLPRLQDWDLILELSKRYAIYYIDRPLVDMHVQKESISSHPERGVTALDYIWKKNEGDINSNQEIKFLWCLYRANFRVENGEAPTEDFKKALLTKFDRKILIKYIMCKLHIFAPAYKRRLNLS